MAKKAVPITLMIAGAAILLGIGLFALDNATSAKPEGLGTWIVTVLGLLLGASAGIKGWVDWHKKDTPSQITNITTGPSNIDVGRIDVGGDVGGSIVIGQGNTINFTPEQAVFRSLHQLPQPPADFTGRDELIALLTADFEGGKGATITAQPIHGLTGMGGIGKTALGLVVAHKIADDYPDAQIFLDLKGTTEPLSAIDVMRHVLLSFEPGLDLRALDETNMGNAYRSVLHGKKVLLFLDNARSAEQIASLRPPETCALLVTSRWSFAVPGLHSRRVDLMGKENAEAFLLELCPRIAGHADELASACANLPLALRIAGSFLAVNGDWKVGDYLAQLNDHKRRLATLHQSHEEAELKTEPDLLATFELSYSGLSEEDRKRWRMLGVFPASFDVSAAAAMWELEESEARKLLGVLLRYSLLDFDEPTSRYSLHDLLADFALAQMESNDEQEARLKHAFHYKNVLSAAKALYKAGGEKIMTGLRLFDLEWENIRTGQAWVAAAGNNVQALSELCVAYPNAGTYILNLRQHPRQQIQWFEAALSAARQTGDHSSEGIALGTLGIAYKDLGEVHKAIEFFEGYLAIARETGDRYNEGGALSGLGLAYADLGDARKAIEFHEGHLAIAREAGDRGSEGNALGNLGLAYHRLGEVRKAIEFHEGHLAIVREIGDRRGEGNALGNLGIAYKDLGEVRKAIEFQEQALVIKREIGDRRGEGNALGNLGTAYYSLGDAHKAIEFQERRLAIVREIGDRLGEGQALGNLGTAYFDLSEYAKAEDYYRQQTTITQEIGDKYGEGNAFWGLAICKKQAGDKEGAREMFLKALELFKEIESPSVSTMQKMLDELEGDQET